ncbi:MAG: hypothetical protein JOZ08_00470 [Verrucomicrobia bacterium]|nr:hypothetical protein [Verrucomicrobiota bacterium]MBV8277475.1 hypothetical protein [Verrucomicrobiota bacterium]
MKIAKFTPLWALRLEFRKRRMAETENEPVEHSQQVPCDGVAKEFLLNDFEYRRNFILDRIRYTETEMQAAILATGALWSWTFVNPASPFFDLVICLPATVCSLFALPWLVHYRRIKAAVEYIKEIERALHRWGLPWNLGWETYLKSYKRDVSYRGTTTIFWVVIIALNLLGAIYTHTRHVVPEAKTQLQTQGQH